MDVLLGEGHLCLRGLVGEGEVDEGCLFGLDVVVQKANILLPLDFNEHLVPVDVIEVLAFAGNDVVVLSYSDRVFGQDRYCLLVAIDFGFSLGLLLVLLVFDGVLQLEVDLVETSPVATLIVDQNVSVCALAADVTGYVLLAPEDVNVADPGVEVIVVLALKAGGLVLGESAAGRHVHLSCCQRGKEQDGQNSQ